jgi:hypothetical protein
MLVRTHPLRRVSTNDCTSFSTNALPERPANISFRKTQLTSAW